MAVLTFYFDGSDAAATDPNAVWSNDANAFDGNTATSANTDNTTGSTSTSYLMAEGTNAVSNSETIVQVRARIYAGDAGVSADYGSYVILTVPTGGWQWATLQALEVKIYVNEIGDVIANATIYTDGLSQTLGTATRNLSANPAIPSTVHIVELEVATEPPTSTFKTAFNKPLRPNVFVPGLAR